MTATLTPERMCAITYHELRDLIEDALDRLPPSVGQADAAVLDKIRRDLSLAIGATYRVEHAKAQVDRCKNARQGMLNDSSIGPDVAVQRYG